MSKSIMLLKPFYTSRSLPFFAQFVFSRHFCSNLQVYIVSTETIKPFSPTPNHLRTFKFSIFDQLFAPSIYFRFVMFYSTSDDHPKLAKKLAMLKCSLSHTLTRFYPLAGRIKDFKSVECSDEGASFIEAQVSCRMSDFFEQPKLELLDMFLPCPHIVKEPLELAPQLVIQANMFECGGIAIGVCVLHKIMDASAIVDFLKEWSATSRGEGNKEAYVHNMAASLFPPNDLILNYDFSWIANCASKHEKGKLRRFVFDNAAISTLKSEARCELVPNPTSNEVVCGFLWKSALNAWTTISGSEKKPSMAVNSVNLRARMKSPMPNYAISNLIWIATALYDPTRAEKNVGLGHFVSLLRQSRKKINGDFVQRFEGDKGYKEFCNALDEMKEVYSKVEKPQLYSFSSVVKMGFYQVDFGWGKPIWFTPGGPGVLDVNNALVLFEGRTGDGIEAWMFLDDPEMAILERDPNFISHVTSNPNIQL